MNDVHEIREYLEELVSLLSQQTDLSSTNLRERFELLERDMKERDNRRWRWFRWIVSVIFISILTIGAYAGDKMYSFIIENDKRLVSIETILRAHDPTRLVSREEVKEMEGRIIRVINELKMRFQVHEDFNSGK